MQALNLIMPFIGKSTFIQNVFRLLKPVARQCSWMDIGHHLCVDVDSVLKDTTVLSNTGKLAKILVKWEESECSPVNWSTIVGVLEKMKFPNKVIQKARALYLTQITSKKSVIKSSVN